MMLSLANVLSMVKHTEDAIELEETFSKRTERPDDGLRLIPRVGDDG